MNPRKARLGALVKVTHCFYLFFAVVFLGLGETSAKADESQNSPLNKTLNKFGLYKDDYVKEGFFTEKVVNLSEPEKKQVPKEQKSNEILKTKNTPRGALYVSAENPEDGILPPDETPRVRLNPEAPSSFLAMARANQEGDKDLAGKYADQYVRYLVNFFFETREITDLIGAAMIRQDLIKGDDWDGVGQFIDYQFATARKNNGSIVRPTNRHALDRIIADPKGQVEVYYFFTLDCSYCRKMAPDFERLYRSVGKEKNVKMVGLLLNPMPVDWVEDYKKFTGLTLPIFAGKKVAEHFNIKFAPAIVVVTPNNKKAYLKTGKENFASMFELVRRAQGLPTTLTPEIRNLLSEKIGQTDEDAGVKPAAIKTMKVINDVKNFEKF